MDTKLPIKDLAPGSIVQMDDGRIGYVGADRKYVMFEPGQGHKAKNGETFKLIHWPIRLALMWMEKYNTREHAFRCGWDAFCAGQTRHANPHIQHSHTWHAWREGYAEADNAKVIQTIERHLQPALDDVVRVTNQDGPMGKLIGGTVHYTEAEVATILERSK